MNPTETLLEFDKIKEELCSFAHSEGARERLAALSPTLKEAECRRWMAETTAARRILDGCGTPPLTAMAQVEELLTLACAGGMLLPEQLTSLAQFLTSCRRMRLYLEKARAVDDTISSYGLGLEDLPDMVEEIERCIRYDQVDSAASPLLRDLRRSMEHVRQQIQEKLSSLLRSQKHLFSDSTVVQRDGRFVLPVKRQYKSQFSGTQVAVSGTGTTCFMEPSAVTKLQGELSSLRLEEDGEVRRVLYTLSSLAAEYAPVFRRNMEAMEELDFLFAKGRLSARQGGNPVTLTIRRALSLVGARHPLLDSRACVPLDFTLDAKIRGVVITGPNTGGKTVALKTVGLLSLMAQCGLHVPAEPESVLSLHTHILCDIGDGQSIAENLSTFSAHMTRIIGILNQADRESLVLLDELGSGTDPAEGMGIAVAVLEELRARGCLFFVTTHYPEVKEYAQGAPELQNARMAFDRETLRPTYRLEQGQAGESCALYIAQRLGFPPHLLELARGAAYQAPPKSRCLPPSKALSPAPGTPSRLQAQAPEAPDRPRRADTFQIGDSVVVYPKKELGIVYRRADSLGQVGVQVKGEKLLFPHKRLKLQVPASELYPPDYDFSILFDTVENRKARHKMEKGHRPELEITLRPPDEGR